LDDSVQTPEISRLPNLVAGEKLFYAHPIYFYAYPCPVLCASVWNFMRIEKISMRMKSKSLFLLAFYGSGQLCEAAYKA